MDVKKIDKIGMLDSVDWVRSINDEMERLVSAPTSCDH